MARSMVLLAMIGLRHEQPVPRPVTEITITLDDPIA
jgi:hypothetical protein